MKSKRTLPFPRGCRAVANRAAAEKLHRIAVDVVRAAYEKSDNPRAVQAAALDRRDDLLWVSDWIKHAYPGASVGSHRDLRAR